MEGLYPLDFSFFIGYYRFLEESVLKYLYFTFFKLQTFTYFGM